METKKSDTMNFLRVEENNDGNAGSFGHEHEADWDWCLTYAHGFIGQIIIDGQDSEIIWQPGLILLLCPSQVLSAGTCMEACYKYPRASKGGPGRREHPVDSGDRQSVERNMAIGK